MNVVAASGLSIEGMVGFVLAQGGFPRVLDMTLSRFAEERASGTRPGGRARIIALPSDYELMAIPLADDLRAIGTEPVCSCVWPRRRLTGRSQGIATAPITMSFDQEPLDDTNAELIIVRSFVDATTEIESILTYAHSSREMRYQRISVVTPFAVIGTRREFEAALRHSEREAFAWSSLGNIREDACKELRSTAHGWIATALGLQSAEDLENHFPRSITDYLNSQPRPS